MAGLIEGYRNHIEVERAMSPRTVSSYLRDVEAFLAEAFPGDEDPSTSALQDGKEAVRRHLAGLRRRGCRPATIDRHLAAIRSFFRYLLLTDRIERIPPVVQTSRGGRRRELPHDLSLENVEALLGLPDLDTARGMRDRALLALLGTYGVRGVQVRRLRLCDIDWGRNRIHFPAAKGGRPIKQHLTVHAGNRLADYLHRGRPASSCLEVFVHLRAPFGPLTRPCELSKILRQRMKQAGITLPDGVSYGSHGFRHAFASRLCGRVPFKDIVDMLGHRDPSSTLIYGKVDIDALAKAALPWPGGAA